MGNVIMNDLWLNYRSIDVIQVQVASREFLVDFLFQQLYSNSI